MKKTLLLALVLCIVCSSMSAFAVAENIIIDGVTVDIPAEMGTVCEKDDRTFVPVRFVTEYLGCLVQYNDAQRSATITDPAKNISYFLMENDNMLYVLSLTKGYAIKMDTKVFINHEEGRMYLPVRFLAEAIGYTVGWEEATQTVTLTSAAE